MTTTVDFHFDPLCPFAYQTSIWMRDVRDQLRLTVNWRFFSLEEINRREGKKHAWERDWSYGWSLMRIGVALRRRDMVLLDDWYAAVGAELHERGGTPHLPETARRLLEGLGVEDTLFDQALADPTTHDEIRADHQRVVDAGGFGVPTLFFPGEQCLFGPVLVDPPTGAEALTLWQVVSGMAALPHVYELQRPKTSADATLIGESLRPYLRGRDWVSINRGQVIELDQLVEHDGK
ncbi:DsbA family protein [Rhodococcus sp. ARC_M6]|uniref:mycothiol-dependent nitroreductase Rv2466c family protein n=1 Tax=Rhodococcus sp. ARC_M6 TaxID=2928852 RepID=UPI001FB2FC09|nr:DsbA family protein [Rhodococcus sp. ARC_M6]MCJ0905643.1 DsbA family protein [Rhodococcus sp. ARC_M6]